MLRIDPFGPGVDSFTRISVVLQNRANMDRAAWFSQLGDAWSMCDNIAGWRPVLRSILRDASRHDLDLMMNDEERAALAAMPERFEVWRGCYARNRPGLSWTTDSAIAERFVRLNRYRRPGELPVLRRGHTKRERSVLKLDRGECEVITPTVFKITEEALPLL